MAIKKGLGRGLEALLSIYDEDKKIEEKTENDEKVQKNQENFEKNGVFELNIEDIHANPNQPRKKFDETALQELAESIKQYGVVQPIVVVKEQDGKYMIIAGERRYRASKIAGLKTIPCVVKSYTERQIKEIALIENLQRENLNPIESARAIKQLMEEYGLTQEVVADRIGKSRPYVTNLLRILTLTPDVVRLIEANKLSLGHAKVLMALTDARLQIKIATYCVENGLSVRELEKLVKNELKAKTQTRERIIPAEQARDIMNFANEMQRMFSTRVTIAGSRDKGRICIDYFSKDDLDRIYNLMSLIHKKTLTLQDLRNFNLKR